MESSDVVLGLEKESTTENIAVLRKGLVMFRGVKPVTEYLALPEFYHFTTRKYSWPDTLESLGVDYIFEVILLAEKRY